MAAANAGEGGLIRSVPVVDRPAHAAPFGGVARIDLDDRQASPVRFIFDELPELGKRPGMQACSLRLSGLNPSPDMREFFNRNRAPGAFCLGNEHLRDNVVCVFAEASLLAREFLQSPLGRLRAASLKPSLAARQLAANLLDLGPSVAVAVAVERDVHDAKVNAEDTLDADFFRVRDVADAGQIPSSAHEHQIDFPLAEGKQRTLSSAASEGDLLPSGKRPDAHRISGQETDDAVVIGLRRVAPECALDITPRFVSVGDLGNAAHDRLCGQSEHLACLGIGQLMQIELARLASLKATGREVIAGLIATLKRLPQQGFLLWRRLKFDVGNQFHNLHIGDVRGKFKSERQRFLPALKVEVPALKSG